MLPTSPDQGSAPAGPSSTPTRGSSASSTPASSTRAPTSAAKDMEMGSREDVEILEERNGSPAAASKRKGDPSTPAEPGSVKKVRLDMTTAAQSTPAKENTNTAPSSSAPSTTTKPTPLSSAAKGKGKAEPVLVEIKANKLKLNQKPLANKLDSISFTRAKLAFAEFAVQFLSSEDKNLDEWPQDHWPLIANIIHESEQTLAGTVTSTKNTIVEYIVVAMPSDDDSQGHDEVKKNVANRVPSAPIKALISSLAERKNYGLENSDLPNGLPDGVKELADNLRIWCWEVNETALLPSELQGKFSKRQAERQEAKSAAVEAFLALSKEDQTNLLESKAVKKKAKATASVLTKPTADAMPSTSKKTKKIKTPEEEAELAEKTKIKAEKEAEKEAKRIAKEEAAKEKEAKQAEKEAKQAEKEVKQAEKDAKKAEREAKKAEREKKEAEKREKEEKHKALVAKQKNMLSGFFKKDATSPAPADVLSSPDKASEQSDFDKVFFPFTVRQGVTVAPVNRFSEEREKKKVKLSKIDVNTDATLTKKRALADFLKDVPPRRIPPYNPHPAPPISVRQVVVAVNESIVASADPQEHYAILADRKKIPVKTLQFREDIRPGYVGTWTKTSKTIGPRTPFGLDQALLNYDVDSEEEWEDDADGEDVASGGENGEDSEDEGAESDALSDDWMCADDEVEYLPGHEGEDEMRMDVDGDDDMATVEQSRQKILDRERKNKAIRGSGQKKNVSLLVPLVQGPCYETKIGQVVYAPFSNLRIQLLRDSRVGLNPLLCTSKPLGVTASRIKSKTGPKGKDKDTASGARKK